MHRHSMTQKKCLLLFNGCGRFAMLPSSFFKPLITVSFFLLCMSGCLLQNHPQPMNDESLSISDGNGNLYEIGPTLLFYRPVSKKQSSSGLYSGGETAALELTPNMQSALQEAIHKALVHKSDHISNREKGSYQIAKNQERIILKRGSASAESVRITLERIREGATPVPLLYNVNRGESPYSGMTNTAEQEERNRTIHATSSDALKSYEPIDTTYAGRPLLFRSIEKKDVVVSKADFSMLIRPDVTRITPGIEIVIGRALKNELLAPSVLLPFLLKGQIIISYWHTDAEIWLTAESESNGRICYEFKGEHHYYTNQTNTEALSFSVCVEPKSRQISVLGR